MYVIVSRVKSPEQLLFYVGTEQQTLPVHTNAAWVRDEVETGDGWNKFWEAAAAAGSPFFPGGLPDVLMAHF